MESQDLLVNNHRFHKMLVEGVDVEYKEGGRSNTIYTTAKKELEAI